MLFCFVYFTAKCALDFIFLCFFARSKRNGRALCVCWRSFPPLAYFSLKLLDFLTELRFSSAIFFFWRSFSSDSERCLTMEGF